MSDYVAQLREAVEGASIRSATGFSWFGKASPALPARIKRALGPSTARSYLLFTLQSQLYTSFYCKGRAEQEEVAVSSTGAAGDPSFVNALSQANTGKGYWSEGWRAASLSPAGSTALVGKDGLHIVAELADCLAEEGYPAEGAMVRVRFGKELLRISPGFYMALSDRELSRERAGTLVRFYWNVSPQGAIRLLQEATARLNAEEIPFRLKAINDPAQYTRCDAAVLYVARDHFGRVVPVVSEIYGEVAGLMRPATPALTLQMAPGLGFAEDPLDGDSFGLSRCRLVADGLITAFEQGKRTTRDRLGVVVERFEQEGISIERPYLNRGSTGEGYTIALPARLPEQAAGTVAGEEVRLEPEEYLRTAAEIAREIWGTAVWYEGRCNWLGAVATPPGSGHGRTVRSLGPDLYDGTAGIALFLAELASLTGDNEARRTARGAIAQAFARLEAVPEVVRLGLYTGWTGIAWAGARVGLLLGEEEWTARALALLDRLPEPAAGEHEHDLLSGSAGAVAGLVALATSLGEPRLVELAACLGDDLLGRAERSEEGCSWPSVQVGNRRNLTGYSHGTAGIGCALLELHRATGERRYYQGAQEAFEYERYWFNPEQGNWPDFRDATGEAPKRRAARQASTRRARDSRRHNHNYRYPSFWCHGAPGIALSRLRAFDLLGDATCRAEAETGVATTAGAIRASLGSGFGNFSLCHGLAGNADVLLSAGGPDDLAHRVAAAGAALYHHTGNRWPCGVAGGGETPSLMLGLAGTGYFYLRIFSPQVPSVLQLHGWS